MDIDEPTFLEKVEEAKKRVENWPEWKKQIYENFSTSGTKDDSGEIVVKIDESDFRARIIDSFRF